ncbi:MAG TPA: LacI family DNA-binding transcriptional regulator [Prolixibacteraceae bacterium]|nr:LacI family DNA-binding transcriptional regulator [Prolixibacteraceae bacterium]HPR85068.1 LacI family DNA-binding transcriptional regulator [Prolixibacteraceae bacterium]
MAKRVSLKDIAAKVGVSTALVSYVLNGQEKEKRVGKEVVEKIRKAADEMNYQPNQIARSLRKGTTSTIGLIVADIANPFFGQLARIIEDEASRHNYVVILGSSDESWRKSASLTEIFLNRQVDGFILVPSEGDHILVQSLAQRNIPLVLIDRHFPEIDTDFVVLDNQKATYEATLRLIDKGCRKIKMVAYHSSLSHMNERIKGYRDAMYERNLNQFAKVEEVETRTMQMANRMDDIIRNADNEALIFATNTLSIAGLYAIQRNNIQVPNDLLVIGFDGNEAFDFFSPPITFIEQPLQEIGRQAVNAVLKQIQGSEQKMQLRIASQLVARDSG